MISLKRSISLLSALALTVTLSSGCAKAPTAELEAAKAAIEAAKNVEADKYMANNYKNLLKALETCEAEIATQNEKVFFGRSYKTANTMLSKMTTVAQDITKEAPKAKEDFIATVKANIPIAKENLVTSAKSISNAAKSKDKKAIVEELRGYLSAADTVLIAAIKDSEAGDYFTASERLDTVQATVSKITETLKPKDEPQVQ